MFKEWYKYLPTFVVGTFLAIYCEPLKDVVICGSIFIFAQMYSHFRIEKEAK